jgi:hypothetical protein
MSRRRTSGRRERPGRTGRTAGTTAPRARSPQEGSSKQNFTAYKLLFTDIVDGRHVAVPRAIIAAGNIMQGVHGGIDIPRSDITRARNHLAKYYKKMGEAAPWERD